MVTPAADVVIIGAGPAGLTAAYSLAKHARRVHLLEADPTYVGGLSRTVTYKGFAFDVGGHRFFSKSSAVEDLWTEMMTALLAAANVLADDRRFDVWHVNEDAEYLELASDSGSGASGVRLVPTLRRGIRSISGVFT